MRLKNILSSIIKLIDTVLFKLCYYIRNIMHLGSCDLLNIVTCGCILYIFISSRGSDLLIDFLFDIFILAFLIRGLFLLIKSIKDEDKRGEKIDFKLLPFKSMHTDSISKDLSDFKVIELKGFKNSKRKVNCVKDSDRGSL